MSDGRRIVLSEDDFRDEPSVARTPPPAPPAATLPPVARGLPLSVSPDAPTGPLPAYAPLTASTSANLVNNPLVALLGIALIGMVVAWGLTELFGLPGLVNHSRSKLGADADVGAWTAVLEVLFVGAIVAGDRLLAGAAPDAMNRFAIAIIPAAVFGFLAGFAGQAVLFEVFELQARNGGYSPNNVRYYFARAVLWALFGLGAGLTVGIVHRSPNKALNGALGGLVGGAAGGVVYWYVELGRLNLDSERFDRLCGLVVIAALIALATRAVEVARRDAWFRVTSGRMVGKEFILDRPVSKVGSAPSCDVFLAKDPAVESLHAQIEVRGRQRVLTSSPAAPAFVNNAAATNHVLRNGDVLRLGNTVLAYRESGVAGPAGYQIRETRQPGPWEPQGPASRAQNIPRAAEQQIRETRRAEPWQPQAKPTVGLWGLAVFFFGAVGGFVGWLSLKNTDRDRADHVLKWGFIVSGIGFVLSFLLYALFFALLLKASH